jgi:hypothetical protein
MTILVEIFIKNDTKYHMTLNSTFSVDSMCIFFWSSYDSLSMYSIHTVTFVLSPFVTWLPLLHHGILGNGFKSPTLLSHLHIIDHGFWHENHLTNHTHHIGINAMLTLCYSVMPCTTLILHTHACMVTWHTFAPWLATCMILGRLECALTGLSGEDVKCDNHTESSGIPVY